MLLREALVNCNGERCLEIGCGNCFNLVALAARYDLVVGTDLIDLDKASSGIGVVIADRSSCFRDSAFDLVVFNPPYLPSASIEDPAVDGGEGGMDIPILFLQEALRVLKNEGRIIMLLSSLCDLSRFKQFCEGRNLSIKTIKEKKIFYEMLYVYEIRKAIEV
jgi:release factor glutamine methyltransferase